MPTNEQLAEDILEKWGAFQHALAGRGSFPINEVNGFSELVWAYLKLTKDDGLVNREIARVLHELESDLQLSDREVPSEILYEADRLERLFFAGYDPYFEGDEPPGL